MRILLSPPHVTDLDRRALLEAFDSGWVAPAGPDLDAFEQDLATITGVADVAAVSSGTAALQLALELIGVTAGDIVLVQSFTFVATASAAVAVGATPVFVDSEDLTWNLSPALVAEELQRLEVAGTPARAVIAVDLYGRSANYHELTEVCRTHDVPLISDAAESLGSMHRGRPAGSFGRFGVLSFNGNKIITTSGGGALLCHNREDAARARYLATQARADAPHYEHTEIGHNFRLSNLLAALGRAQLLQLPARVERRRAIRAMYASALADVPGISVFGHDDPDDNAWLTCVLLDDFDQREIVRLGLATHDIESRPLWKPMHLQPVFAANPRVVDGTSEALFGRGLCLPSGSAMTDDDVEFVCAAIRRSIRGD